MAERGVRTRDAVSLTTYGFLFGALFFAVIQPWWAFPTHYVSENVSLLGHLSDLHLPVWALMLWIIVLGAIVPFALFVGALHHIPATRASIVAMFEPVVRERRRLDLAGRGTRSDPDRRRGDRAGRNRARADRAAGGWLEG